MRLRMIACSWLDEPTSGCVKHKLCRRFGLLLAGAAVPQVFLVFVPIHNLSGLFITYSAIC